MGSDRYFVGTVLRILCIFVDGNAGSAPCPDGYGDRSGYCSADYLLPEANFVLEPKGRSINSRITGAFNEGIMGAKTSKTLVIEDKNTHEFSGLTEEMRNASVRAAGLNALYIPLVMLASSAATAIVLARGGNLVLEHGILIGTLSAFTTYAVSIFEPIQQMARVLANIIAVQPNIERVMGLLDQKPNIVDTPEVIEKYGDSFHPKTENWEPIKGDIEFDDVSFWYPDGEEEVLSHFSLKIPAGTNVAIVGELVQKSTLVNLACRSLNRLAEES